MDSKLDKFPYGYSVQVKIMASILSDREFVSNILDSFSKDYFDNKALQWLCEKSLAYYIEFKNMPTLEVFQMETSKLDKDSIFRREVILALKDVWTNLGSLDLEFVKKDITSFCKGQEIKKFLIKGVDLWESRDFEGLEHEFKSTVKKINIQTDLGLDYLNQIDYRYAEKTVDERIELPWQVINEITGGGLPKKKLGIVMAPTGVGKSWFLAAIGAHALKTGKTVLHYTLELDDIYTAQRYDAILTGLRFGDLKYNVDTIKKTVSKYESDGKLFIKEFPPGTLSLNGLESHIDKYIMSGVIPDLIILDYVELMKINFNNSMKEVKVLGELYKDLRGLAGLKNVALWSADQTNRDGSEEDVIGTNKISNSYEKMFAVDFLMTLSRKEKDKQNKTARVHIAKSRLGTDGITFPCKMDTETGFIDIYPPKSEKGKKTTEEMVSDEAHLKAHALDKFYQFANRNRTEPDSDDVVF